jgi:hypothetical protein
MTARTLAVRAGTAWERFFYGASGVDGRVLALLRMGFGVLVLVHVVALFPHVGMLWSESGMLPLSDLPMVVGGRVPTLLALFPSWEAAPYVGFALLGVHACLLFAGYRSRLQAGLVFVWLVSFQNRNPLVTNGQDALLSITAALLVLLPIGSRWSLDVRGRSPVAPAPETLWPHRLLELQVSFVMLSAALWKVLGSDWTNGTALHYVTRLRGFWGNLPVPAAFTQSETLLAAATYLTLAVELLVPLAIWVPHLRRTALVVAIAFHLTLAYAMNLFLFPWVMIIGWCSFLRTSDLELVTRTLRLRRFYAVQVNRPLLQRIRS